MDEEVYGGCPRCGKFRRITRATTPCGGCGMKLKISDSGERSVVVDEDVSGLCPQCGEDISIGCEKTTICEVCGVEWKLSYSMWGEMSFVEVEENDPVYWDR